MAELEGKEAHSSVEALPLDDNLFQPTTAEVVFLKETVDQDEQRLKEKILTFQRRAYNEYPYLCIRAFHFVSLMMAENPAYSQVLKAVKGLPSNKSPIFLDLGCCMGTDVRKLALDGYPASSIIGCDLRSRFIDLGHELYQDSSETCPIRFITGDMFDIPLEIENPVLEREFRDISISEINGLSQLLSRVKYLYVGAVFHLFDEPTQLDLARRLARLVRREEGVVIFGRHQGLEKPSLIDDHFGSQRPRFAHSPASWSRMWQSVFIETDGETYANSQVIVNAELSESDILRGIPVACRQITWSVHLV